MLGHAFFLQGCPLPFGEFRSIWILPYTADVADKTRVTYEGVILESKLTATGGHVILNVSGVSVFIEGGAENIFYKTGDRIRVIGIADTYAGSREIVVGTAGSVTLIG